MANKKGLILSILGIISVVLITVAVTYAFYNYAKEGTTDNQLSTGKITFIYEEIDKQGAGISIENAYPISDENGKILSGTNEVFNFSIKSDTMNDMSIPYTITVKKDNNSTLIEDAVRIYLTEVNGSSETEILLDNYNKLRLVDNLPAGVIERVVHTDMVPSGLSNYVKNYRLRMWVDEDIKFSPDENGNYPYNNQTFKITVNVYANRNVTTEEEKYEVYSIGDSVTLLDGSKWHVLEESSETEETVVLLSDYNLNSDGTYNDECGKNVNDSYVCSTIAFDTNNTNIYDETDSNNVGYFIKYTYEPKVLANLPDATNISLPTVYQIALADSQIFNGTSLTLTSSWLVTTTYWTKTSRDDATNYNVWFINPANSRINYDNSNAPGSHGARPAITVPKEYIVDTMNETTELSIGTSVEAIDGSKWHVLEESNSDSKYVTLLSDYNLNSDGTYNTECGRDINDNYKCSTMVFDTDNSNVYDGSDIENFILNKYQPLVTSSLLETTNVTLPTAFQIAFADSQTFAQTNLTLTNSWLLSTQYWTKTAYVNTNTVWSVYNGMYLNGDNAKNTTGYGARPVITTLKTNLLNQ